MEFAPANSSFVCIYFNCINKNRCESGFKITKFYKIRRNLMRFCALIMAHTPENNRVSKEKR
jgi:hypothetical protein